MELTVTQFQGGITLSDDGVLAENVAVESFAPYVTTVGLYNAANQLLAVGKLSQPYPIPSNTDITFVVKYDS